MLELHVCNRHGVVLRAYALGDSEEVVIGRDARCDVRITASTVSREHCAIEWHDGSPVLRDLGSTGGTYADGNRLDEIRLRDGIEIRVGPAILKFLDRGS